MCYSVSIPRDEGYYNACCYGHVPNPPPHLLYGHVLSACFSLGHHQREEYGKGLTVGGESGGHLRRVGGHTQLEEISVVHRGIYIIYKK